MQMTNPELSDHDRVRAYIDKSSLCRSVGEKGEKLLRFLVLKTLEGHPPQAKEIATDLDNIPIPNGDQEMLVRDRISKLRKALSFYYDTVGKKDLVKLRLPDNAKRDGYRILWEFADSPERSASQGAAPPIHAWIDTLSRSGLTNAFRIKKQNRDRLQRVTELICEESKLKHPYFRLVASSGFSYLNSSVGPVWVEAGLGEAVYEKKARFDVVLESPFSDFAECRALANGETRHQWDRKVDLRGLERLQADRPNVRIRVTEIPVNCSLFVTSKSVFYDPYLWARPNLVGHTENNFWVLEFQRGEQDYDCYELLKKHFAFVWENSITLKEFLKQKPSYRRRTELFEQQAGARIRQTKARQKTNDDAYLSGH
jgi:hypothetical protein